MWKYFLSLILILFLGGVIIYQQDSFRKIHNKIKEEILDEWRRQREVEERIKQEIESKRKTQEFLLQLDHERKLIESLQQELTRLKEQFQNNFNELKNYLSNKLNLQGENLKSNQEKIFLLEGKLNNITKDLFSQLDDLKKRNSQLETKVFYLKKKVDSQNIEQQKIGKRIEEILLRINQLEEKQTLNSSSLKDAFE